MSGALLSREAAAEQAAQQNVNATSSPSALKITDLRVAVEGVEKPIINIGWIKVPERPGLKRGCRETASGPRNGLFRPYRNGTRNAAPIGSGVDSAANRSPNHGRGGSHVSA